MTHRLVLVAVLGMAVLLGSPADAGFFDRVKQGLKGVGDVLKQDKDESDSGGCSSITGIAESILGSGAAAQAASVGCLVGGDLMKILGEDDQAELAKSTEQAIATGENSTFEGDESGVHGKVTVTDTKTKQQDASIVVLKDKIEEMPPLQLIGAEYAATSATNVRGGPGTDYKKVGALAAAETVQVIAKVEDKTWYLIGQGGVATGFVYQTLLAATGQIGGGQPAPEGEVAEIEVATQVTCHTIEQEVTLDDGSVHTEQIQACQKPDGSWEMA